MCPVSGVLASFLRKKDSYYKTAKKCKKCQSFATSHDTDENVKSAEWFIAQNKTTWKSYFSHFEWDDNLEWFLKRTNKRMKGSLWETELKSAQTDEGFVVLSFWKEF